MVYSTCTHIKEGVCGEIQGFGVFELEIMVLVPRVRYKYCKPNGVLAGINK